MHSDTTDLDPTDGAGQGAVRHPTTHAPTRPPPPSVDDAEQAHRLITGSALRAVDRKGAKPTLVGEIEERLMGNPFVPSRLTEQGAADLARIRHAQDRHRTEPALADEDRLLLDMVTTSCPEILAKVARGLRPDPIKELSRLLAVLRRLLVVLRNRIDSLPASQ